MEKMKISIGDHVTHNGKTYKVKGFCSTIPSWGQALILWNNEEGEIRLYPSELEDTKELKH
jgi:hypothetical protein